MSLMSSLKDNLEVPGVKGFIDLDKAMEEDDEILMEAETLGEDKILGDHDDQNHTETEDPDLFEDEDIVLDDQDLALLAEDADPEHTETEDPDLDEDKDNTKIEFVDEESKSLEAAINALMESDTEETSDDSSEEDVSDDDADAMIADALDELKDEMDEDPEDEDEDDDFDEDDEI